MIARTSEHHVCGEFAFGPNAARKPVDRDERNAITFRVVRDTPTGIREVAMADSINNGVNVDALIAARDALTKAPEAA
ncbi:MAG TPA: hypothetical protein VNQ74_13055, partial [Burkholderiaceae bacterium]|nr:hypothetical protein [Burkholderiaceae bacterium]